MAKIGLVLVLAGALMSCAQTQREPSSKPSGSRAVGEFYLSGPYQHENLAVYLVHGRDRLADAHLLTLAEALAGGQCRANETGRVNELTVENLSVDQEIFMQAGDIVRGGKQDRCLGVDLILPPRSGPVKITAFCVEQGRWQARGGESATYFARSEKRAAGRQLKLQVQQANSQPGVWAEVEANQRALNTNLGVDVRAAASASSFELTLENDAVQSGAQAYMQALRKIVDENPDVLGYVFAINGEINCADLYASRALFGKLWPRLLESSAVEALAARRSDRPVAAPSIAAVQEFLRMAESAPASSRPVGTRVRYVTRATESAVQFETYDDERGGGWIHRNCMRK